MRAWQVTGTGSPHEVLASVDVARPEPGPGMVRLAVAAAALGLPDVLMCRATYPLTPDGPFTPGQEVAGTVTALGLGVDRDLMGRRLLGVTAFYLGHGGLAEEALAPAATLFPVPDDMADADAAAFYIAFHTAWIGLCRRARLQADETLLVLGGAGGSGAAAVALGHSLGSRVIAVVGSDDKARFCRRLGAAEVIDHRSADVAATVRELTDDRGADVIFDPVGGEPARAGLAAIASEGRHLLVGFASGQWAQPRGSDVAVGNYSLVGVYAGAYDRAAAEEHHRQLLDRYHQGTLGSIVTGTISRTEVPAALERIADRSAFGKTVMIADP